MSCIVASLTRIGGAEGSAELNQIGGTIKCTLERFGGVDVLIERVGGISASLVQVGGRISVTLGPTTKITVRFDEVCSVNIKELYLEINPTIIWVYPDLETDNDVISNTRWNVD